MVKLFCLIAIAAISLVAVKADGESRIVGGRSAVNGQFPHVVDIRNITNTLGNTRPSCAGSIIGFRFVLTTAACVEGFESHDQMKHLRVIVGEVNVRAYGVQHEADRVTLHPEHGLYRNDIAVLRTKVPFTFTDNVRPIRLPTRDTPITTDGSEVPAIYTGWGQMNVRQSKFL